MHHNIKGAFLMLCTLYVHMHLSLTLHPSVCLCLFFNVLWNRYKVHMNTTKLTLISNSNKPVHTQLHRLLLLLYWKTVKQWLFNKYKSLFMRLSISHSVSALLSAVLHQLILIYLYAAHTAVCVQWTLDEINTP